MQKDVVIYIGGGAMLGVFGAGVATTLQELNLYPRVKAVYGSSAGALDLAYFLSRQTKLGSSIYYEDLITNFIYPGNLVWGALQRLWNGFVRKIPREKIVDAVDVNYVFDILQHKKVLDIDAIFETSIDFYIGVLSINGGKTEYKKAARENIIDLLKASASAVPYWFPPEELNSMGYTDGAIGDPTGIDYILNKHPDCKLILVINDCFHRGFKHRLKNYLEGIVSWAMFNKSLYRAYINRENLLRYGIKKAKKNKKSYCFKSQKKM